MAGTKRQIKVLVVDDSAFMRNALRSMIVSDPELKVVGVARDGVEALEMISKLKPDVVTLDVEMPKMDGLETLRHIMAKNPLPVIMVSSLTVDGAKTTLDAIDLGAVDFLPKNLSDLSVNIVNIKSLLVEKLKHIGKAKSKLKRRSVAMSTKLNSHVMSKAVSKTSVQFTSNNRMAVVTIGTSTGGPKALQTVIPCLPKSLPVPVLISQHMPPAFTGPFSQRLNQLSAVLVKEAKDGEKIRPGVVYIAPGFGHMRIFKNGIDKIIKIEQHSELIYKPSVDFMMLSIADVYPGTCLGVMLTGMGNDGLKGMVAIKNSGGRTIAQDEGSCIVYGMPKAVVDSGVADKVVSLNEVAGEIINSI